MRSGLLRSISFGFVLGLAGCAAEPPSGEPHLGLDDVAVAAGPGVRGTVWAPNNGPGDVPEGREVPVAGALVRLLDARPDPVPEGVHCRRCLQSTGFWATFSDAAGHFELTDVDPGAYWLVIEAGPFRRDVSVVVEASDRAVNVSHADTELPSDYDPDAGRFAPRVALLSGAYDPAGHWLGQLGYGGLDADGSYTPDPRNDRVDVYFNGGSQSYPDAGHAHDLLRDPERLARYHVLLVPSSDTGSFEDALALSRDVVAIRNLRDWVRDGGVLIATGRSSRFADAPWPAAIELGPDHDVPASAYDGETDGWRSFEVPPPRPEVETYDSPHSRAVDQALASWLAEQRGPGYSLYHWGPDGMFVGPDPRLVGDYDPEDLPVLGSSAQISALGALGAEQMPPRVLVEGANGSGDLRRGPIAVAFEPPGCGRLFYSTAPLSPVTPHELTVMERVALYFLVSTPICAEELI